MKRWHVVWKHKFYGMKKLLDFLKNVVAHLIAYGMKFSTVFSWWGRYRRVIELPGVSLFPQKFNCMCIRGEEEGKEEEEEGSKVQRRRRKKQKDS
jgi:hypothetical protein